ncbi:MAG: hypothetical protein ACRC18_07150 [Cetobacterium sp.]
MIIILLDRIVNITWNNATKKWYESKGYIYTKSGDTLTVNIDDMIKTSTFRVNVKCDYCGKDHCKEYRKYISGRETIEKDCCSSKKCLAKKTKEINLKLYGVESCMQRDDIKDKVSEAMRTSFEDVLFLCNEKGLELISDFAEYKNDRSRIDIICKKHRDKGVQNTNLANIKKIKHCCFYGGSEETGKQKRLDFKVVLNKFLELGHTPLFEEVDYEGNYSKLEFICNKHKDKGVQLTTYGIIQQGSCGCNYCAREVVKNKLKLSQEFVFNEFAKRGLDVVDGQTYANKDDLIAYTCKAHPCKIQYSTYNNLKKVNQPCDMCRNEESLSDLNRRFRSSITKWKSDTEKFNNYKCVFTKSSTYDIHHIHPYNEIIKESLVNLGIDKNTSNGTEIEMLKNEVVRLHEYYGLGVCIHPKIHSLFHVIYGKTATIDDFNNFKKDYINGLYKNDIDIN